MSRELRRVPKNWKHPKRDNGNYDPLLDDYEGEVKDLQKYVKDHGLKSAIEYFGVIPIPENYMPVWTVEEKTHYMMYETCSEGTPISPACETPEELAKWLYDNNASSFASSTSSYENWLAMIRGPGWSVSAVLGPDGLKSGVDI